jgi:hypothetical protein
VIESKSEQLQEQTVTHVECQQEQEEQTVMHDESQTITQTNEKQVVTEHIVQDGIIVASDGTESPTLRTEVSFESESTVPIL